MTMARGGFKLTIRPGTEAEYKERHQRVYQELLDEFQAYGITTYSIFMDGCTLFAYMEAADIERVFAQLAETPANMRWQAFMSDILVPGENGETMQPLEEVFFFHPS